MIGATRRGSGEAVGIPSTFNEATKKTLILLGLFTVLDGKQSEFDF
jgi:hypothetical protein